MDPTFGKRRIITESHTGPYAAVEDDVSCSVQRIYDDGDWARVRFGERDAMIALARQMNEEHRAERRAEMDRL